MDFRGLKDSFHTHYRHSRHLTFLRIEELEPRDLFSAGGLDGIFAAPDRGPGGGGRITNPNPVGYTPAQISHAYGFDQIMFGGVQGNGARQTIAIVDAFDDPNIYKDLDVFDNTFGVPGGPASAFLTKATPEGHTKTNASWAGEISLDVEWAHALAPGAKILLVEAATSSLTNLLNAVTYANNQSGVVAVSMSWGGGEFSSEVSLDGLFTTPGITYVAAAGDNPGVIWPSASPNVVSVGGTTLPLDAAGDYPTGNETGWSDSIYGSTGGGTSAFETLPGYQTSVATTNRSTPDVAFDADPVTGVAIYDSVSQFGQAGWFQTGGTSLGAPAWAALVAIADQGRGDLSSPLASLGSIQTLTALYANHNAFHDITSGTSGSNSAGPGYDQVTGLGTPIANNVVQVLVGVKTAAVTVSTAQTAANSDVVKSPPSSGKPTMIVGSTGDITTSSGQPLPANLPPVNGFFIYYNSALPQYYSSVSSLSLVPAYTYVGQTAFFVPTSYSTFGFGSSSSGGFGSAGDYSRGGLSAVLPAQATQQQSTAAPDTQTTRPQKSDSITNPNKAPGDYPATPPDSSDKDKVPPAPANKNGDAAPGDGFWELGLAADDVVSWTNNDAQMEVVPDAAALVPGLVAFFGSSWGIRLIDPNTGHKRPKLTPT